MATNTNETHNAQIKPKFEQISLEIPQVEQEPKKFAYTALNNKIQRLDKMVKEIGNRLDELKANLDTLFDRIAIMRKALRG